MTRLEEALDLVSRLQALIHEDEVYMYDEEETITKSVMGGSGPTKKTGRRVLTIKIPYTHTKEYIVAQMNAMLQYKAQKEAELAEMDDYLLVLEDMLTNHR